MNRVLIDNSSRETWIAALKSILKDYVALGDNNRRKWFFDGVYYDVFNNVFIFPPTESKESELKARLYFDEFMIVVNDVALAFSSKISSPLPIDNKEVNKYAFCCMKEVAKAYLSNHKVQKKYGFNESTLNNLDVIIRETFYRMEGHKTFPTPQNAINYFSIILRNKLYDFCEKENKLETKDYDDSRQQSQDILDDDETDNSNFDNDEYNYGVAEANKLIETADREIITGYQKNMYLSKLIPDLTKEDKRTLYVLLIKSYSDYSEKEMAEVLGITDNNLRQKIFRLRPKVKKVLLRDDIKGMLISYLYNRYDPQKQSNNSIKLQLEDLLLDEQKREERVKGGRKKRKDT